MNEYRRDQIARQLKGAPAEEIDAWATVEPFTWALANARLLREAGLSAAEALDLRRRSDDTVSSDLGRLVDAGRMADLETRWLHWWAASGLLRATAEPDPRSAGSTVRRPRRVSFTRWVTEARRYVVAVEGNQELASLAAAAHLSVDETRSAFADGTLDKDALAVVVALREQMPAEDPPN